MRTDSRIILLLGLGDDTEASVVQAMATDRDILLLESPFDTVCPTSLETDPHIYFAGAPAVQRVNVADAGALQRAADAIATRYGRLDWLVFGSRPILPGLPADTPWQRVTHPYRFDRLAAVMTCLPLLAAAPVARIVDLTPQGDESELAALLKDASIRHELLAPSPKAANDVSANRRYSRGTVSA